MALADPPRVLVMSTRESGSYEARALDVGPTGFVPESSLSTYPLEESRAQVGSGEAARSTQRVLGDAGRIEREPGAGALGHDESAVA